LGSAGYAQQLFSEAIKDEAKTKAIVKEHLNTIESVFQDPSVQIHLPTYSKALKVATGFGILAGMLGLGITALFVAPEAEPILYEGAWYTIQSLMI